MNKRFVYALAALFILLTFSMTMNSSQAAGNRSPGVHAGDTASYSLICTAVPDWDKFDISITKIEGTIVSYDVTFFYSNGMVAHTIHYTSDVQHYNDCIEPYIVAGNLSAGDQIAEYDGYPRMINKTVLMDIAGSQRLVNYREFLTIYYVPNVLDRPVIFGYDMYWDKATGMTVKANVYWSTGYSFPAWQGWFNWTMTSLPTNAGVPVSDPTTLLLVGGGVAAVLATVAVIAIATRRR